MAKQNVRGKAQAVLGLIDGSQLGITLPHEHFSIDSRCYMIEPTDPEGKKLAHQKITLENLWYARSHNFNNEDNLLWICFRASSWFHHWRHHHHCVELLLGAWSLDTIPDGCLGTGRGISRLPEQSQGQQDVSDSLRDGLGIHLWLDNQHLVLDSLRLPSYCKYVHHNPA